MSAIEHVHARQILDSRGNPTVEVDVRLESGAFGRAAVPSGASTGTREAVELRDGDAALRRQGRSRARSRTSTARSRGGRAAATPPTSAALDERADRARRHADTRRASARTRSSACRWPRRAPPRPTPASRCGATSAATDAALLPVPMMNVLNGGAHADNPVDFQEFMIAPVGAPSFAEAIADGRRDLPRAASSTLQGRGLATAVGDEGGFAPALRVQRGAARAARQRDRERPATARATTSRSASTRPRASSSRTAATSSPARDARSPRHEMVDFWAGDRRALPDAVPRGRHGRGRLGRLAAADRALGARTAARRRRHLRHQPGDPARGHRRAASPTRS